MSEVFPDPEAPVIRIPEAGVMTINMYAKSSAKREDEPAFLEELSCFDANAFTTCDRILAILSSTPASVIVCGALIRLASFPLTVERERFVRDN